MLALETLKDTVAGDNQFDLTQCEGIKRLIEECPLAMSSDLRTDVSETARADTDAKRDAEDRLKEAKERHDELYSDAVADIAELSKTNQENETTIQKQIKELNDQLPELMSEIDQKIADAYDQMQQEYNKMDQAYVQMRDAARQATLKSLRMKDQLLTQCRAYAESKVQQQQDDYNKRQAEIEAAIYGGKAAVNYGSPTKLASRKTKVSAQLAQIRSRNYSAYYNECAGGAVAAGSNLRDQIRAADDEAAALNLRLTDQMATIENQRLQMIAKVKSLETQAPAEKQKIYTKIAGRISELQQELSQKRMAAQQEIMMKQATATQQQKSKQDALQRAEEQLTEIYTHALYSRAQKTCLPNASAGFTPNLSGSNPVEIVSEITATCTLFEPGALCATIEGVNLETRLDAIAKTCAVYKDGAPSNAPEGGPQHQRPIDSTPQSATP